ncbi:MAG: DUF1801 domain-containing protein [Myxococcota bacterium]
MKRDARTPETYRADIDEPQRTLFEAVRTAIREVAPDIDEGIAHGMLDYPGLANLAAQKHTVCLYLAPTVLARHRDRFPEVDAGKSCLRFRRIDQVDPSALRRLLQDTLEHRRSTADADPAT